jgi:hypothetical protein
MGRYIKPSLIKSRGHRCEKCGLSEWFDQPIPLEIHHIKGKSDEDENLQLLCANCHAQTPDYRGRGIKTGKKVTDKELKIAAKECSTISKLLQKVGLVAKGGNYATIRKRLEKMGLLGNFQKKVEKKQCLFCDVEIVGFKKKFCSSACSNEYSSLSRKPTNKRPEKWVLHEMIENVGFEATGRAFGVSSNAIRKWLMFEEK